MLVVHVELWPGGNPRLKQHIGTMTLVNETPDQPIDALYSVHVDGEPLRGRRLPHNRGDGAWKLVYRALRRKFRTYP